MKAKNLFCVVAFSALLTSSSVMIASAAYSDAAISADDVMLRGDVNSDGAVSVSDATLIQRHAAQLYTISDERMSAADVNADNVVSVTDATLIQKYIAGISNNYSINEPINNGETESTTATEAVEETTVAVDENAWKSNTGQIVLSNNGITVTGEGISVEGNVVTISDGGDWEVVGACDNGMIYVNTGEVKDVNDKVKLRLNGMSLTNENGPAVFFDRCKKAFITLESGTENYVSDSSTYAVDYSEAKAAIHSDDSLEIKGKGTLNVTGSYKHAINCDDDIVIENGVINILSSVKDGIHANDAVEIDGKNIVITADTTGDAIESEGYLTVESATLNFTCGGKGLNSESYISLTNVNAVMDTVNDCINSNAAVNISDGTYELESDDEAITGDTVNILSGDFVLNTVGKGIKSTTDSTFDGGNYTVNSTDDALHSNGNITINAGTYIIASGDDGVHADTTLTINDCIMTITESYEGLEGCDVIINGGTISIVSSDDGINAAGGTDSSSESTRPGGMGGSQFKPSASSNYSIQINGGYISVVASGDGLDSNGSLTFSGGITLVQNLTNGGDFAIDADGTITFSGGVVMAACSSNAMWEDISNKLSGGAVMNKSIGSVSTDTIFAVKDFSGNVLSALQSKLSGNVGIVYFNNSSTASTVSTGGTYSGTLDDFGYGSGGSYTGGNSYTLSSSSSSGGFRPGGRN